MQRRIPSKPLWVIQLPRESHHSRQFTMGVSINCEKEHQQNTSAISEEMHKEISETTKVKYKINPRLMQWNADGLKIKSHELARRLTEMDIDVCMIQESKLSHRDTTPKVQGCKAILRTDRPHYSRRRPNYLCKKTI